MPNLFFIRIPVSGSPNAYLNLSNVTHIEFEAESKTHAQSCQVSFAGGGTSWRYEEETAISAILEAVEKFVQGDS